MKENYFENLNYTLANEDAWLEYRLLEETAPHVVAVSGSGGRVLPLLARGPKLLSVLDISPVQLAMCELRVEAVRSLSYEQYLRFWEFYDEVKMPALERKKIFHLLSLKPENKILLERFFEHNEWKSLLLCGRWERTFKFFSKLLQATFRKEWIDRFFNACTLDEHRWFLKNDYPHFRWKILLHLIGNGRTFNALLYKGSFPQKNIPGSMFDYYQGAFDRLMAQAPARHNFFLQLCFLGELKFKEGIPVEADEAIFAQAKRALANTRVQYIQADLIDWIEGLSQKPLSERASFISLSNVPSYFSGELESSFLRRIRKGLQSNAKVVLRHYMRVPEGLDRSSYIDETDAHRALIQAEKMQMYQIEVLRASQLEASP